MKGIGRKLQEAREEKGLTVDYVATRMRIDEAFIEAIETEAWERLPPGPYTAAWVRTYCTMVHVPEPVEIELPAQMDPGPPLWVARVIGLGTVFLALVVLAGVFVVPRVLKPAPIAKPARPDQTVSVYARRNTPLTVRVDGQLVFDKILLGKEHKEFSGYDRVEVDVPSVDQVKITYNRINIVPQGRQDLPRTLVFVDDGGG